MTEEPLNVQVARAMGCNVRTVPHATARDSWNSYDCTCKELLHGFRGHTPMIADFPGEPDLWTEILERERYSVQWSPACKDATGEEVPGSWFAEGVDLLADETILAFGATPGEAVCRLFVKLKGAQK